MPRQLMRLLASLVVPPLCVVCREPDLSGSPLCAECAGRMRAISNCCSRCGAPLPCAVDGCLECRGRGLAFDRAWAPFVYAGAARELVLALKVRDLTAGAAFMAAAIAGRAPPGLLGGVLVPVPAHPERMRTRGQNHARELAWALGRLTGFAVRDVLVRRPGGARQVGLERHARRANVRGAIGAPAALAPGMRAVLVDDVYTTGATLDASAAALAGAGAGAVSAVCFARAVRAPPPVARRLSAP